MCFLCNTALHYKDNENHGDSYEYNHGHSHSHSTSPNIESNSSKELLAREYHNDLFLGTASDQASKGADALMLGIKWGNVVAGVTQVSYAFESGVSEAFKAATFDVLQKVENIANIKFVQLADTASANITLGSDAGLYSQGYLGVTYPSYSDGQYTKAEIKIASNISSPTELQAGNQGHFTLMHEIGHAVGLKHSHDNGLGLTDSKISIHAAISAVGVGGVVKGDSYDTTVMSYNQGNLSGNATHDFMFYDVAGLQQLYGANTGYNAGNDTYVIDGSKKSAAIWDGGGIDTILIQNNFDSVVNIGEGVENVTRSGETLYWFANGTNIENIHVNGTGNIDAYGNNSGNGLIMGAGNNFVSAKQGNDEVSGGSGEDVVYGGQGDDRINGNQGNDRIYGHKDNDYLNGGQGNDHVDGGDGNDLVSGDKGNDHLFGGQGSDIFAFRPGDGGDVIHDFEKGVDKVQFTGGVFGSAAEAASAVSSSANGAVITANGISITVLGVSDISEADILIG